jgi:glycosyltransferase involved in cell wall biosynthesis
LDIPNACQTHTLGILSGFCNNGCNVDAIIPRPKYVRPTINGTKFFFLWPWRFSGLGKLYAKCLAGLYLLILCCSNKYDAIYVREFESYPFPRWCARLFSIPYCVEVNGINSIGKSRFDQNRKFLRKIEKKQKNDFHAAELLIVPSVPRANWIRERYSIEFQKVKVVLNGTNVADEIKLRREIALKKLNLPENGFYLGFLGSVWECYDLISVLKAMRICRYRLPNIFLMIIGGGVGLNLVKRAARRYNLLSKIIDLGFVQPNELYEVVGAIDVALMNLTVKGLNDLGPVTTRFATYAAYEIPVIANRQYLDKYPEELSKGLFAVPHENHRALASMLIWLFDHPEKRAARAMIIKKYVQENLTWDICSKKIMDSIIQTQR